MGAATRSNSDHQQYLGMMVFSCLLLARHSARTRHWGDQSSSIAFEQWMELDIQYLDEWSLWLDLKILARTIPAVVKGSGAACTTHSCWTEPAANFLFAVLIPEEEGCALL